MPEIRLAELRAELSGTYHDARVRRMVELGRLALKDAGVREILGVLSRGDAYERRLALFAQFTWRDGRQVLAATTDASARVRFLSFQLVALVCDDLQALEALKMAYAIRRDGNILRALACHGRRAVIDVYLDWLSTRESVPEFADIVPLATPAGLRRHLPRALARPSACFWSRLARHAPEALAEVLADHVRAVEGAPDAVTRLNVQSYLPLITDQVPDAALMLFELLLAPRPVPGAVAQERARPRALDDAERIGRMASPRVAPRAHSGGGAHPARCVGRG
ncbi:MULTISPECIES: hypothetical protein [Myxococcus]|uniref:hypothetical protein n=1 Tax=Myxococcus TaxID=32 RepID=UPI001141C83F|nr:MULTISPECIES: hypothetical protein [Myxococcus]NOK03552.1 hypothetical protein [Myxococcus xanthus]